jgi:hypothetical protein
MVQLFFKLFESFPLLATDDLLFEPTMIKMIWYIEGALLHLVVDI